MLLVVCTVAFAIGRGEDGEALALPHGDGTYYYVYLPSLWLDGDVDFDNQYAVTGDPWQQRRTPTDRAGNVFGIGPALYASPLFLTGHIVSRTTGGRGDGFGTAAIWLTGFASVLASIAALWFAYRLLLRRLGDDRRALAATVLAFAGGPVLFYAVRQPHMAHPFATLFAAWLIDAWDESYDRERTLRTWIKLGVLLGCAVLARPQLATWSLCLVVAGIADLRQGIRFAPRIAAGAAAAFVCVLPQLITWKINYGSFAVVPQGDAFMRWDAPAWSETLFSSRNGLLPWSPLFAIALVGLIAAVRRMPRLGAVLLAGIAAQAVVNGAAWDWWAGGSFGARRFDSTYIAFAFGLGFVLVASRWRAVTAWACAIACGWLAVGNVVMTAQTTPHSMRQKGGEAAADVIADKLGVFGIPIGWLSSLTNLPARAVFAIRHDTSLAAYDNVVGVHWLAETYPELSTKVPRTTARRMVADIPVVFRDGFVATSDVLASGAGRVLIGLNRRREVHVELAASCGEAGTLVLAWNGSEVARGAMGPDERAIAFDVARPERGVNELSLRGPARCRIVWIELRTEPEG